MKRIFITTIVFAGISVALLFAMSVRSFAGGQPQGPPFTPPVEGGTYSTACVNETNSNARITPCESADDCQPHEVCVNLSSAIIAEHGCSSLIGGGITGAAVSFPTKEVWLAYFPGNDRVCEGRDGCQQSVESAGSFRNLNVILGNENYPGDWPTKTVTFKFDSQNGVPFKDYDLTCSISGTDPTRQECTDTRHCVDVGPGDYIELSVTQDVASSVQTIVKYTTEFNQCICCDGLPPVDGTCVRDHAGDDEDDDN